MTANQFSEHILILEKEVSPKYISYHPSKKENPIQPGDTVVGDHNECPAHGYCAYDCDVCHAYTTGSKTAEEPIKPVETTSVMNTVYCPKIGAFTLIKNINISNCIDCSIRNISISAVFQGEVPCK